MEDLIFKPVSWTEPLRWEEVFAPVAFSLPGMDDLPQPSWKPGAPVHVDLGAGDGGFLRDRARAHPGTFFLGVERLLGRVRKISRRAIRAGAFNVRALRIEAAYAAEFLIPPASADAVTVLFPDPWPKRRHHVRRLISPAFLALCARCLKPGGWLAIKTDDAPYAAHIREALAATPTLRPWPEADPAALLPEKTDFEADFIKEGRRFHFFAARVDS